MDNPFIEAVASPGLLETAATVTPLGNGLRIDISVRNPSQTSYSEVRAEEVRVRFNAHPKLVMEHGWQSWSVVGPRRADRPRASQRMAPFWVRAMLHADPSAAGRYVAGDQFLLAADGFGSDRNDAGIIGALSGNHNLTTVTPLPGPSSRTDSQSTSLWTICHLDGISLKPGEERRLDPLYVAAGDPGEIYSTYLDLVAGESKARNTAKSPLGWCTWYHYYLKVKPQDIIANTLIASRHGFEVIQVDDCFQSSLGDWTTYNPAFDGGRMAGLVAEIAAHGMQPGIWTAPFLASPKSSVVNAHPDWVCLDRKHKPLKANWNPVGWGGWGLALDTTNPAVLEHLRKTYASLAADGWTYHKIDFLYAAAMAGQRSRQSRFTRAESIRMGLEAVREGMGEDAYLLGCGCPLAQAVGIVDAMRVSPDTAALWSTHALRLPGYPDTVPSLRSALRMTLLRAPMHRRLWVNDPDCILVRDTRTRLTPRERRIGAGVIVGTGGLRILSDDLATYGSKEWELIDEINAIHRIFDKPLHILDPFARTIKVVPEDSRQAAGNAANTPMLQADVVHVTGRAAHTSISL
ncbi:MAG: alpha-galactosidase [Actinobacteria bacterium]|nr:alpha-galactosidase [Actinomycetota bacterium]